MNDITHLMIEVKPQRAVIFDSTRDPLMCINYCGRTSYMSKIPDDIEKRKEFVANRIKQGHESILEHCSMTVEFFTNRAIANELVRHRHCAFTQESTRFRNYTKNPEPITFIEPTNIHGGAYTIWENQMRLDSIAYYNLIKLYNLSPDEARGVLPLDIATTLMMTTNFREWRHIFKIRTAKNCHYQMRELMKMALDEAKETIPVVFDDITYEE